MGFNKCNCILILFLLPFLSPSVVKHTAWLFEDTFDKFSGGNISSCRRSKVAVIAHSFSGRPLMILGRRKSRKILEALLQEKGSPGKKNIENHWLKRQCILRGLRSFSGCFKKKKSVVSF